MRTAAGEPAKSGARNMRASLPSEKALGEKTAFPGIYRLIVGAPSRSWLAVARPPRYRAEVAKRKKQITAAPKDTTEALEQIEQPKLNWRVLGLIGLALAVVWVIAGILQPSIGYVGLIVAAVLTLIALGFLIWIWRLTRKSADIAAILKGATDKEGRIAALEQLRARQAPGGKDALNAIAQAQLVAQEDPAEAIRILEGIDIDKAPAMVQDDVRANLAMFYLMTGRARDARELANDIRLDRQPQAKAKAMYAAVVAESFARTKSSARFPECSFAPRSTPTPRRRRPDALARRWSSSSKWIRTWSPPSFRRGRAPSSAASPSRSSRAPARYPSRRCVCVRARCS